MIEEAGSEPISVALVIDQLTFDRLGPVIGHLSVGLLDFVSQVTLITPAAAAHRLSLGPVRVIQHRKLHLLSRNHVFRTILKQMGTDVPAVIHAFSRRSFALGEELALETGRPLIGHVLSRDDLQATSMLESGRMHRLITASGPLLEAARERRIMAEDRLILIRPGLLPAARPSCFVDPRLTPTLLCLTAMEATTGVDRLIRATRLLADAGKELMLFILNSGPKERACRKLIESERLIKHVTIGEPTINWSRAMEAADIFVVPAPVERVDVRLLHALAAGMAAVTCAMPNSDFMIHNQTGLVCEESTPDVLAATIRTLLDNRDLARHLARQALDYCKKHHSLSKMAEETASVYGAVIAESVRRSSEP